MSSLPFILVRDLDVMDPNVGPPDIDSVQASHVRSPNDHVIDLAVLAGIHDKVKRWGVDKSNVVNAEVGHLARHIS